MGLTDENLWAYEGQGARWRQDSQALTPGFVSIVL